MPVSLIYFLISSFPIAVQLCSGICKPFIWEVILVNTVREWRNETEKGRKPIKGTSSSELALWSSVLLGKCEDVRGARCWETILHLVSTYLVTAFVLLYVLKNVCIANNLGI